MIVWVFAVLTQSSYTISVSACVPVELVSREEPK
jgi:hypothetical protein